VTLELLELAEELLLEAGVVDALQTGVVEELTLLVVELVELVEELLDELVEELVPHPPGTAAAVPARATATMAAENFIFDGWVV